MVVEQALTAIISEAGKAAINHLRERVKDKQDLAKLVELKRAFDALLEDNRRLRDELRQRDNRAAARANYERRTMGQATVLVLVKPDGTDGPPCCPKCSDDDGEPLPLQGLGRSTLGTHMCVVCQVPLTIRLTPPTP